MKTEESVRLTVRGSSDKDTINAIRDYIENGGILFMNEKLEDIQELHDALSYMYFQHNCGCGNPACNRCYDDIDNSELLHRIGMKYELKKQE